jgi:hypothetical protein
LKRRYGMEQLREDGGMPWHLRDADDHLWLVSVVFKG